MARATAQRQRLPAPQRREKVLEAALALFAEQGYAASMGDMAKAAGITRTVLYHYFPSKEQLFLAVLEAEAGALLAHIAPAVAGDGDRTLRAERTVDALLGFAEERPEAWQLLFEHQDDGEAAVREARARVHEQVMSSAAVLLARDMDAAGLSGDPVRTAILGEANFGAAVAVVRWWRAHPRVPRATVAKHLFELLWHGSEGLRPSA